MTKPISVDDADAGATPAEGTDAPDGTPPAAATSGDPAGADPAGAARAPAGGAGKPAAQPAADRPPARAGIVGTSDDPYPDGYSDATDPDGAVMSDDELPGARALWILAFTFAVVGLFFPLAGLIAIGCGALAWRSGSGRGRTATLVAIGTTLVGIIFTIIVLTT